MTHRLTLSTYALLALVLSAGLLIGAWIFQYGLGYAPCQMCFWQRHAHKAVIGIAALVALLQALQGRSYRLGAVLIILAFLVSAGLALWHVGVELKWIEALPSCSAADVDLDALSGADLLGSLDKKIRPPACSEVAWSFLGLSMAGWNAVASLSGAILGVLALRRDATIGGLASVSKEA